MFWKSAKKCMSKTTQVIWYNFNQNLISIKAMCGLSWLLYSRVIANMYCFFIFIFFSFPELLEYSNCADSLLVRATSKLIMALNNLCRKKTAEKSTARLIELYWTYMRFYSMGLVIIYVQCAWLDDTRIMRIKKCRKNAKKRLYFTDVTLK